MLQVVRLVLEEGKSVGAVARDLDLTEWALRQWVERTGAAPVIFLSLQRLLSMTGLHRLLVGEAATHQPA